MNYAKHIILFASAAYIFLAADVLLAIETEKHLPLGYKAYQDGNYEKAMKHLDYAANNGSLLADYAFYYLGEAYLALGDLDEALRAFSACAEHYSESPMIPSAREKIADIHLAKGNVNDSIAAYRDLITVYSDSAMTPVLIHKLVSILIHNNRQNEAEPFIKRLLTEFAQEEFDDGSPTSQVLSNEIWKLNYDEFYARANALLKARNYEKAIAEISTYLSDTHPSLPYGSPSENDGEFRLLLAKTFYQSRNYEKAKDAFNDIFYTTTDSTAKQKAFIWLARTYIRLKDIKFATYLLEAFIKVYPHSSFREEALYKLAMIAKDKGDTNSTVSLLKQLLSSENDSSTYKITALWQIAWIYYTEGYLEHSLSTLKALEDSPLKMRALYWQAKISLAGGDKDKALELFKPIADISPPTYYSILSRKAIEQVTGKPHFIPALFLDTKKQIRQNDSSISSSGQTTDESISKNRAQKLLELGLNSLALKELAYMEQQQHDPVDISLLYREAGDFYRSHVIAKKHISNLPHLSMQQLVFTMGYKELVEEITARYKLDPFLIYAIMMQESEFDDKAVSHAGAIGLMQIMPGTGKAIAGEMAYHPFKTDNLLEPDVNIGFGAWYIKDMLKKFNGRLPLALAAYNAGPNAVKEWVSKWKDLPMDEFIENIPYRETRKYVEKVLGYYDAYKEIYHSLAKTHFEVQATGDSD